MLTKCKSTIAIQFVNIDDVDIITLQWKSVNNF